MGNERFDFRDVQVRGLVISRAAGSGHHLFAVFHLFDKLGRFFAGGDVGADRNFDNVGKAELFQGADQVVDGAGELAENGRRQHGDHFFVFVGQKLQHVNHLRHFDHRAERTGLQAFAAEDAFFRINVLFAGFVFANGADRAGFLTRDRHPDNGVIRADFLAASAGNALVGVDG